MLNQLNSVDLSVIEEEREDAIVVEMRNTLKMPRRAWKVDGCERQEVVQQVGEQAASGLGQFNTQVGKQAASGFGEREEQAAGMKNVENGEEAPGNLSEQVADASGGVGGVPIPGIHDGETVSPSNGDIVGDTASGHGDLGSGLVQREALQPEEIETMVERQHPEDTADAFGKPVFTVGPTGTESWVPVTPPPLSNAPSFEDSKIPKVSSASGQVRALDDEPDQVLDNLSSLVVPDEAFGQLQEFGVDAGKVVAEAQATPTISPLASASAASGQGQELDVDVGQVLALALPSAASGQGQEVDVAEAQVRGQHHLKEAAAAAADEVLCTDRHDFFVPVHRRTLAFPLVLQNRYMPCVVCTVSASDCDDPHQLYAHARDLLTSALGKISSATRSLSTMAMLSARSWPMSMVPSLQC